MTTPTGAINLNNVSASAKLTLSTLLPREILSRLNLRAVDQYLLLESEGTGPMALRVQAHLDTILDGGRRSWVPVGSITEDLSGWDDAEGKWEYDYRDDVVFARREELEAAIEEWNKTESALLWKPFAGLGA